MGEEETRNIAVSFSTDGGQTWGEIGKIPEWDAPTIDIDFDYSYTPQNELSFTLPIESGIELSKSLKRLTPKMDRRLIHTVFYHKRDLTRKKAIKRLQKMGYKITFSEV